VYLKVIITTFNVKAPHYGCIVDIFSVKLLNTKLMHLKQMHAITDIFVVC